MITSAADREFRRSVQQALAHIYQPAYLRANEFAASFVAAGQIRSADELPALLLGAIERLAPPEPAPRGSAGWRQYRYMRLRYVECLTHRRISEDLQVSARQACREHEAGLSAVADWLWTRYAPAAASATDAKQAEAPRPTDLAAPVAAVRPLETEQLRIGSEPPDGPTSLREVLDGALSTVSRLAADRGLAVTVDLEPGLPPVVVNRLALRHALLNLIGYLVETSGAASLAISAGVVRDTGGDAAVEISFVLGLASATSIGATDATVDAVAGSASREHPGLAVTRQLMEMQGGRLRLERSGASVSWAAITLPATQATMVLLVDDSADIGRLFRRYIAGTSYYLVHVRSAEKALRLVRESRPGVILLDVLLPRDDGWQFLGALREDSTMADIPVIVCSVVPEGSLAVAFRVEFLPKPISQATLLAALDSATAGKPA